MIKETIYKKIDLIAKESLNNEQKQIAKAIIEKAPENQAEAWYQFITTQVKLGFVFDAAPEVQQDNIAVLNKNNSLSLSLSARE